MEDAQFRHDSLRETSLFSLRTLREAYFTTASYTTSMRRLLPSLLLLSATLPAYAQKPKTEPILMLSDIHFDPFQNPTLVPQLVAAKVKDWPAILATPTTPAAQQAYQQLQQTCKAKGSDTNYTLLTSSLAAEHAQQPAPLFITVSGDLMAHQFDCRFKTLVPKGSEKDYSDFASNTVAFVAQQLHATFAKTPIYFALGNNDSGCKDYREDTGSSYLANDGKSFAAVVLDKANAADITTEFSAYGDYKVALPAPFKNTHLLVMQDIFESKRYTTCDGKDAPDAGAAQVAWLRSKLDEARTKHEHIWVMAHIPPGIDAYSTFTKKASAGSCPFADPTQFLNSDLFATALADYTDVVSLVLLGHTHMDEMRLYTANSGTGSIPGKLVPSISPVDGNDPSFTVGTVDPARSMLVDYTVYAANNQTGIDTKWSPEYTYSTTFHQPDYSAASLTAITNGFLADPGSKSPQSQAYESHYFVGGPSAGINLKAAALGMVWPIYACSLTHDNTKSFAACACASK
jgi:sphingomyelin phosphodiesterase acid-like 3